MTDFHEIDYTLHDLIRNGEGEELDFKQSIDDQKKIARTLVAFANTVGGSLLIGVKDNGKVSGIDPSEEYHMINGAAGLYCTPPVSVDSRVWQEKHKLVLEVVVGKSETLHRAVDESGRPRVYIRLRAKTIQANKILYKYLMLRRNGSPRPESLSEEALGLLRLFKSGEVYTLSKLYRLASLPKKEVDHYISLFLAWELIAFDVTESTIVYFSNEPTQ